MADLTISVPGVTGRRRSIIERSISGRFLRSTRGVVALEFALIAPFLITLLLGSFEMARYTSTMRRLTYLSQSIATTLAENNTGYVDWTDFTAAHDSTMLIFSPVLSDAQSKGIMWWSDVQVSMSSVAFTPTVSGCTSNCTYTANVAWSYGAHGATARACNIPLTSAPNTSPPSPTTLPTDVYTSGSLIVVDAVYNYTPLIAKSLFGTMTIKRSSYIQPRYVSLVKFQRLWSDFTTGGAACPGY